ncbi:MAG: rRNA maturation RNase YbeY [Clostridiales bacterium]|nr:rRNA maturation RNase YbeY [Clostridiales bacterium]
MTMHIFCEQKPDFSFHYRKLAQQVAEASLESEQFPFEAEIALTLVGNDRIQSINRETRGIDAPTDVLSFPMLDYPAPADFSEIEEQWEGCVNPDTGEVMLGDIVISLDKVREQAEAYGHSRKREYAFLITHSMLHLMGYDHMEPEDAALMEAHQKTILETLEINR